MSEYTPSSEQSNFKEHLLKISDAVIEENIAAWFAGGYVYDVILGELTRDHHDFDLVVDAEHKDRFEKLLEELGYQLKEQDNSIAPKYIYTHPDMPNFELEFGCVEKVDNRYEVGGYSFPLSYFPSRHIHRLEGRTVPVISLEAQIEFDRIQAARFDHPYKHVDHRSSLLERIRAREAVDASD